jgi:hypothetical protein
MQKLTTRALAVIAGVLTLLVLTVPDASAVPRGRQGHVSVQGTWTDPGPTITGIDPSGSQFVVGVHGATTTEGSFAGTSDYTFSLRYDPATGRSQGLGQETFTAVLDGLGAGTISFREHLYQTAEGASVVTGEVLGGDGVFAGAHGSIRFEGASQPPSTAANGGFRLELELG